MESQSLLLGNPGTISQRQYRREAEDQHYDYANLEPRTDLVFLQDIVPSLPLDERGQFLIFQVYTEVQVA